VEISKAIAEIDNQLEALHAQAATFKAKREQLYQQLDPLVR
jgi:hypothetical protein